MRILKKLLLSLVLIGGMISQTEASSVQAIPYPNKIVSSTGEFVIDQMTIGYLSPELMGEAEFLKEKLSNLLIQADIRPSAKTKGTINLLIDPTLKTPESYKLTIQRGGVVISGSDKTGIFYGIQTLLQQIRAAKNNAKTTIPAVEIEDSPRYHWRGFMLDVSRHFFGPDKIKQLLDNMAMLKLNKFHWHLTDSQGWRIEIKKYPKLATIGGQGTHSDPKSTVAQFYTQEEIKDIVAYAAKRHIEIIPEIDMPGHATAANKAYPEYSGGPTPKHPHFTFNPGKEETYAYLTDILKEITELFPSKYIHLGGDEVSFGIKAWEDNDDVQALMKRENLKTLHDAEVYFNRRMASIVKGLGKKVMGWDELVACKLDPKETVIMWWRHDRVNVLKDALGKDYPVIMCPRRPLYFDFIQQTGHKRGRVWNGFNPLQDVYEFPDKGFANWKLDGKRKPQIMGIQANLWTENYSTDHQMDYMVYPRICALAESAWSSPENKNFDHFQARMEHMYKLFDTMKLYYFDPRDPSRHPELSGKGEGLPQDFRD